MLTADERITAEFMQWSLRGQGMALWDGPVSPEPAFTPYRRKPEVELLPTDDGRKPTILSSFVRSLSSRLAPPAPDLVDEPLEEGRPRELVRQGIAELQILAAPDQPFRAEDYQCILSIAAAGEESVSFELIADGKNIVAQFAGAPGDIRRFRGQLEAFFPESIFVERVGTLRRFWEAATGEYFAAAEFGLEREFQLPIRTEKFDPFTGLVALFAELQGGELGVLQVLIEPVRHPWAEHALRSVTDSDGKAFFLNAPELFAGAKEKASAPLYAAVVRVAFRGEERASVETMVTTSESVLRAFQEEGGNRFVLLRNDDYPTEAHAEDVLARQSRRSGCVLNGYELASLVHIPSADVHSSKLVRHDRATRAVPTVVLNATGSLIGRNLHAGKETMVRITPEQRLRHTHIIGASGTGKSTLLFNLVLEDLKKGGGVAVLDPHGDLVDRILGVMPAERIKDVVLLDPSDTDYPVGFNILRAHSELEKTLLASDLVSVFERLSTSWGDQMGSVLSHAVLAFLESDKGGSLLDLRRFLLEPAFRSAFLEGVRDPEIVYYWKTGFPQLTGNKSIGPILTRLETFLTPKSIRHMVSQRENRLDFADILDTGKIFLAKLSQGAIGRENSYLLGTLLVSKFQQLAMARQSQAEKRRRDYFLYIDEFPNFITPSMAEILAGARKYRLGLVLAHQELRQLEKNREVSSAVMANTYSRICFRVGDSDARALEAGFSHFEARDLQNLGTGEAICRIERSDFDFNIKVPLSNEPDALDAEQRRAAVVAASRATYGRPRAEVEATLRRVAEVRETPPPPIASVTVVAPEKPVVTKSRPSELPAVIAPEEPSKSQPRSPAPPPVSVAPSEPFPLPVPPAPPPSPGRGGREHKYLQTFIKQWAEGMGWRATIEASIDGQSGSVDVLLAKAGTTIACEITVTTSVEHEAQNLEKCVRGDFTHVFSICADESRMREMGSAVKPLLSIAASGKVRFATPTQLFALVGEIDARNASRETTVKGYRVKVNYKPVDQAQQAERMMSVANIIAKSIKRLGTKG